MIQGNALLSSRGEARRSLTPGRRLTFLTIRHTHATYWPKLSRVAGCETPRPRGLTRESTKVRERRDAMLTLGAGRSWPDDLEGMTRSRDVDASAILDYPAPPKTWLAEQTAGQPVGW